MGVSQKKTLNFHGSFQKTIPKAKKVQGVENAAFAESGLGVTPERLREDLNAQRRNRKDATPIPVRRESPGEPRQSVAESYHSTNVEPDGGPQSRPVTYLELEGGPTIVGGEVINTNRVI